MRLMALMHFLHFDETQATGYQISNINYFSKFIQ